MSVVARKPPAQLEAEAASTPLSVIHQPANPWRGRLIWAAAIVAAVAIGMQHRLGQAAKTPAAVRLPRLRHLEL